MSFLHPKKISPYYLVLFVIVSSFITFLVTWNVMNKSYAEKIAANQNSGDNCGFNIKRLNGDSLIKPILFVENSCESENLQLLKNDINNIISSNKEAGTLISASVYLRKFLTSEWICSNGSEYYNPGSMLKVPELIAYLKMNEINPGLLDKKLLYDQKFTSERKALFVSESIKLGQQYTIRELLSYMIKYSDNAAAFLLLKNIDVNVYKRVFADFGLAVPSRDAKNYPMCVSDYSIFMRALFNASYLDDKDSEFAIELLSDSDYKMGVLRGVPGNLRVAHKFGEEGNIDCKELHESAIIYLENSPYLLTIMTKGKDITKQSKVLEEISSKIYQELSFNTK
jgi:beta-lactamase class A